MPPPSPIRLATRRIPSSTPQSIAQSTRHLSDSTSTSKPTETLATKSLIRRTQSTHKHRARHLNELQRLKDFPLPPRAGSLLLAAMSDTETHRTIKTIKTLYGTTFHAPAAYEHEDGRTTALPILDRLPDTRANRQLYMRAARAIADKTEWIPLGVTRPRREHKLVPGPEKTVVDYCRLPVSSTELSRIFSHMLAALQGQVQLREMLLAEPTLRIRQTVARGPHADIMRMIRKIDEAYPQGIELGMATRLVLWQRPAAGEVARAGKPVPYRELASFDFRKPRALIDREVADKISLLFSKR